MHRSTVSWQESVDKQGDVWGQSFLKMDPRRQAAEETQKSRLVF